MKRADFIKRLGRAAAAIGIGVVVPDGVTAAKDVLEQGKKVKPKPGVDFNASGYFGNSSGTCFYAPRFYFRHTLTDRGKLL